MNAVEVVPRLETAGCPWIIDVRSKAEYRSGHIPGAVHIPFWGVLLRQSSLPDNRNAEIVLTCEHGLRAQIAAAQLGLLGFTRVVLLERHMSGWRRKNLPIHT